jgi:hypothetical protein
MYVQREVDFLITRFRGAGQGDRSLRGGFDHHGSTKIEVCFEGTLQTKGTDAVVWKGTFKVSIRSLLSEGCKN